MANSHSKAELGNLLGRTLLCATDQGSFDIRGNSFCVLTPLMTENGDHIEDRQELFPNRGRIWWMVREELKPATLRPGTLCSVVLERAIDFDESKAEKDFFQARRQDAHIGSRQYIEVIQVEQDPDPRLVFERNLFLDRQPKSRLVLAGPTSLLGPFHAEWDDRSSHARLKAVNPGNPIVWRIPKKALPRGAIHEFSFVANKYDPRESDREIQIALLHQDHIGLFEEKGEVFDAADDSQVVNWALGLLKAIKRDDRRVIKKVLDLVRDQFPGAPDAPTGRLERFQEICASLERVLDLNEEIARTVAEQEGFEALVRKHIDAAATKRVEEEVRRRSDDIERRIGGARERYERLEKETASLEEEYSRRVEEQEEELRRENEAWIKNLQVREAKLEEERTRLDEREREIETRLEAVLRRYREESDAIAESILAQLPILKSLGLIGESREPEGGKITSALSLPSFLEHPRERGGLNESEFLDQFSNVVRQRGYVFDRDDLANFHICVKTGSWTVLTGPSGTGKSSLPRLYAEALGALDELLWIAVRPDWMDDRDLIGSYNALSGRFEPAACGLVDRLIAASEDARARRGGIYLVCLDEMNLSRVEHYFARFLSQMARPPRFRVLELFARGLGRPDDPYLPYRKLPISRAIRFVGTVNIDETTHFFSPKVIDRSSLLVLEPPDLLESAARPEETGPLGGLRPVHAEEYEAWIRPPDAAAAEDTRKLLLSLNETLEKHHSGLGHRSVRRFLGYVASAEGLLPPDRAFDLAFAQTVIPRLRTMAFGYLEMLDKLQQALPEGRFPRSASLLDRLIAAEGAYDFFQVL